MRYLMTLLVVKLAIWTSLVSPALTSAAVISGHFGMLRYEILANKFLTKCVSVVLLQVIRFVSDTFPTVIVTSHSVVGFSNSTY